MANAFSPQIGDMGGTNVRPMSAPSIDFSSLAKGITGGMAAFSAASDGGGGSRITEKEKTGIMLDPVKQDLVRASQIEDPNKRDITLKQIYLNAQVALPGYGTELKQAYEEVRGIALPTGSPMSQIDTTINEYAKTPEGVVSAITAMDIARNEDGSIDEETYKQAMYADALKLSADKAKEDAALRAVNTGKNEATVAWKTELLPGLVRQSEELYQKVANRSFVQKLLAGVRGNEFDVERVIDEVRKNKQYILARAQQVKAMAGISQNEGEFSNDPIVAQWTALENTILEYANSMSDGAKKQGANIIANAIANVTDPMLKAGLAQDTTAAYLIQDFLSNNQDRLAELPKALVLPQSNYIRDTEVWPGVSVNPSSMDTFSQGLQIQDKVASLPEFDEKAINFVAGQTEQWKATQIRETIDFLKTFTPDTIDSENKANGFGQSIGWSFLSLIERPQSEVSKPDEIQTVFGTYMFQYIDKINSQSPVMGEALYKQAHKYALDETNRQFENLRTNLNLLAPPGSNPFEVVVENNNVSLKLNQDAVKKDTKLKEAIADARRKTRGNEPTPYQVMESYMSLAQRGTTMYNDIYANIRSLNIIYQQMNKMPDYLKSSQIFGQKYIPEKLTLLPKYSGLTPRSEVAPVRTITLKELMEQGTLSPEMMSP